jgi:hypothetical protein
MGIRRIGMVSLLVVLAFALPACKDAPAEEEEGGSDLATVEPIEGSDVSQVTLSEEAAGRLDIETATVASAGTAGGKASTTIPYAAVLYDPAGDTWTYTNPDPLVFVRAPIDVVRINGEQALLSSGPPPGTDVVIVGAAELLGTEYEVGEE